ncbi:MAG: hypothetical protein P8M72_07860 [Gammaproteobacteria bacterium]|nr:hypothetical protein [Gammaproteobacteria bacterium]
MKQTAYLVLLSTLLFQPSIAAEDDILPEEITVEASRDRINLQLQVDQAENQFYALFNDLVDDEDFRIECQYERVVGSIIKERICQTKYMRDELSTAATLSLSGVDYMISAILTEKNSQLREKAMELLENNPAFRNAAQNLSERVEEYQDEYGIEADKE